LKSRLSEDFIVRFRELPDRIQRLARKNYKRWKTDNDHPSLQFKRVGKVKPVYSIRVGIGWRAFGLELDDNIIWFWIGSHAEYSRILKKL
jgi:hypothetical protein